MNQGPLGPEADDIPIIIIYFIEILKQKDTFIMNTGSHNTLEQWIRTSKKVRGSSTSIWPYNRRLQKSYSAWRLQIMQAKTLYAANSNAKKLAKDFPI